MKTPHRCSRCQKRFSFRRHWQTYKRFKKCDRCGSLNFYVDKTRMRRDNAKLSCWCDAYHYPHRRGSGICAHGPDPYGYVSFEPPPSEYEPPDDPDIPV